MQTKDFLYFILVFKIMMILVDYQTLRKIPVRSKTYITFNRSFILDSEPSSTRQSISEPV